jgi:hypothetical protein
VKVIKSFCIPLLVSCICSIHLCQSIFFSGGELIPGNLGDTRLVNLILEHNFQSLIGDQKLFSPSQFYPEKNTLFYSFNVLGTTPIYILPRTIGFSMESSFQAWFFIVEVLNAIAFIYLLKTLNISPLIGYPLTFSAVSASAFVYKIGQPQLLAMFAFFFGLACLVKFIREPNYRSLLWFGFWGVYQHYCSIYQGFFGSLIICIFLILNFLLSEKQKYLEALAFLKKRKVVLSVLTTIICLFLFALYFPYYQAMQSFGSRSMQELEILAPRLSAWFSASPHSMLYSELNFLDGESNPYNKHLFSGFVCYIIFCCGVLVFIKKRKEKNFELTLFVSFWMTAFLLIIVMTTWKEPNFNIWLWLSEKIEPLRAFRAFARIGYMLFALKVLATAIMLNYFYNQYKGKIKALTGVIVCSFSCAIECIASDQTSKFQYEKSHAQKRVNALTQALDTDISYEAIAFCPGSTLDLWNVHLDAWNLALLTKIPCLNGYSGNIPTTHVKFLLSPTRENAEDLVEFLCLDKRKVVFIENWSTEIEKNYPVDRYELNEKILISTQVKQIQGAVGENTSIKAMLDNPTGVNIPCSKLNFHPSYRLYDPEGVLLDDYEPLRSPVKELKAFTMKSHELLIKLPNKPGKYILKTSFVHEYVNWMIDLPKYVGDDVIVFVTQ